MNRKYSKIMFSIWSDDDFRQLTRDEQHLYLMLCTSPTISYCGVADWRPRRLLKNASDMTLDSVMSAARTLANRLYIVIDEDTEEVLVRSYIRNDEVLKQPRLVVSMTNAYSAVASPELRGVIVHELHRLRDDDPELRGWEGGKVDNLLAKPALDPASYPTGFGARLAQNELAFGPNQSSVSGQFGPNQSSGLGLHTSPATSTTPSTKRDAAKDRGTRLGEDWVPSQRDIDWARQNHPSVDLRSATEKFMNYWLSKTGKDATKRRWDLTWRNWIKSEEQYAARRGYTPSTPAPTASESALGWMDLAGTPTAVTITANDWSELDG